MKRTLWALVAVLLLVAATVGCSPSGTDTAGSQEPEDVVSTPEDAAGEAPETAPEDSDASGPATLTPETDGEKNALVTAETEEARLWGSGDTVNGTPVEGDPFLVGYGVLLHDGVTQYQVVVIDGAVQRFFGNTQGLRYIEAPFSDFSPTITPESDRQREASVAQRQPVRERRKLWLAVESCSHNPARGNRRPYRTAASAAAFTAQLTAPSPPR